MLSHARLRWRLMAALALLVLPGAGTPGAEPAKTRPVVAVLAFENIAPDKGEDWRGAIIAEDLMTALVQVPELAVVERSQLGELVKELKWNRSQYVDPATAQKIGRQWGAQSVIVGSYQHVAGALRITARLVQVETGEVRAATSVEGPTDTFRQLEVELSKKVVTELKGVLSAADRKQLESAPVHNVEASKALSDGIYFVKNDMLDDALARFDQAIALEPDYGEAHFHKGLALAQGKRWDDAIAAFKRALPRSEQTQTAKWRWDVPYDAPGGERGRLYLSTYWADVVRKSGAGADASPSPTSTRLVYTERAGGRTVLHLLDLARRAGDKIAIDDPDVPLFQTAQLSGDTIMFQSGDPRRSGKVTLVIVDLVSRRVGRVTLDATKGTPVPRLLGSSLLVGYAAAGRWAAIDPFTGQVRWQREGIPATLETIDIGWTRRFGSVAVARVGQQLRSARLDTGVDVWTTDLRSKDALVACSGEVVVVAEPGQGVSVFDIETGALRASVPIRPLIVRRDTELGNVAVPQATAFEDVFYVRTTGETTAAIDLRADVPAAKRLRWNVALGLPLSVGVGTLLAGTQPSSANEVAVLDAETGAIRSRMKLGNRKIFPGTLTEHFALTTTSDTVVAIDPSTGTQLWTFPSNYREKWSWVFKDLVVVRTAPQVLTVLSADTGRVLWQYSGMRTPWVYGSEGDTLFIGDETGVKEYTVTRTAAPGMTEREVFTQMARASLERGNVADASSYVAKALKAGEDYGPAHYLRARILKLQGDRHGAGSELARFLRLEGPDSSRAQEVLPELKRDHGLVWQTDANVYGAVWVFDDKVVVAGSHPVALERDTGRLVWHHEVGVQRFFRSILNSASGRLYYATGSSEKPEVVQVFSVAAASGERNPLATLTFSRPINGVQLTASGSNVYVLLWSNPLASARRLIRTVAIRVEDGKLLWQNDDERDASKTGGVVEATPDRFVYAMDREISLANPQTGALTGFFVEPQLVVPAGRFRSGTAGSDASNEWLFWATGDRQITGYNVPRKQVAWRMSLPEYRGDLCACRISGQTLYEADKNSIFAVDLRPEPASPDRVLWRAKPPDGATFNRIVRTGGRVFAVLSTNTLVEFSPEDGRTIAQYPLLWPADDLTVVGDTAYAVGDGLVYAVKLAR